MSSLSLGAAHGARAAAKRLAPQFGSTLIGDVERALSTGARGREGQYLDPVALSAMIIAAADFSWTIYNDLHERAERRRRDAVARRVRDELAGEFPGLDPAVRHQVIDAVVEEIVPSDEESPDEAPNDSGTTSEGSKDDPDSPDALDDGPMEDS